MGAIHVDSEVDVIPSRADRGLDITKGEQERRATASKIAKAVLTFQNQLLDRDANTGSLCQVHSSQ